MRYFVFDLQRFDTQIISANKTFTLDGVTYTAVSDAVLNLDDEGAVSGIASGVVVAKLTDADSSPQITFDGSTAFEFSCSSSDSALQVKASGTSIRYTGGQVTYSADGFSGAGEVSVTGYMGNILPFDVVFDVPESGIKFTFDSDNNTTTLNADEKVNATLTFPESVATLIENIKPLLTTLLNVDEDTANKLYAVVTKLVSSPTTGQVQGVHTWNQNDKKLTINQGSFLALNVLDYALSMTAEGGNVDGLSFFSQLTGDPAIGARFTPSTDENAGLNFSLAKSGSKIYDGLLNVTAGAIDIDIVNVKASVEKDTAVTMTLQDGSLAEFKFDNAASITYSANESGLAYLTFGENDGKLEMTIYRGDTPVFKTGIEINGSLTLDTDNQTVGMTKDTTTIITIGNNTATINVTDDAGFKIGLSNDAITITPQEGDGSLNVSLAKGDETVFQNTVSVSNGSIIFNPATQEMTLTDGTTISFLINDNYTLTATASGDATSTLSLSTSGVTLTPSTDEDDGTLNLTLTGTSSGSLSANIEVLSGSFILSEGGALTVAKDTELQIKFSDDYIINFKATDNAGGAISLGADGITFAPGSDDGGLQLSITRDGQTRSASLDVTGSVTYKLDGSISLAQGTVVRNVFDSGNILTITANTDASGSINFNPQTGLTITPATADALTVSLTTGDLEVVKISSIDGSINYSGGVVTASDGTRARITYYFGWKSDLYTTGGTASLQFTADRTIYTANEGANFVIDYLDGDYLDGTTAEIQNGTYSDIYATETSDAIELISEGSTFRSNDGEQVITLEKAGNYTLNGMAITTSQDNTQVQLPDYDTVIFEADAGITFNEQEFSGSGTVTLTDGNITIENTEDNAVVNGTALADSISNSGASVTITGGEGDDLIQISGDNVRIQYSAGDGNDTIEGLNETSTLSVGNNLYSTQQSGDDLILTVGENKITLVDAANLDELNIVPDVETATSLVGAMLYRTEAGYPVIAGMAFHPTVYHSDEPTNYVDKETWTIKSSNAIESADGLELSGIHYTPENSNDKWVVIIHGYGHNHKHMYPFAGFFLDNGYNVLMVDQRAAGDSEGSWLTMGTAESADIALWTQEIARRNPDSKITLFGVSMGAATAMLAAARSDIANVTSLVEDCGYSNVVDIINLFNDVLLHQDQSTVDMMMPVSESLTGYNLEDAAPINSISAAKMPTLFITGSKDTVVAGSMLPALYNASGAEVKEQFIVEGATHGMAGMYDPVGYSNTTFRFLAEANGEGWETSNTTDDISLRGTKYNDTIDTSGDNVTINTGEGDDYIYNTGENVLFLYNEGDGSDTISGFNELTALQISGDYATATSGDDVVVTVGEDAITLTDAASLDALNISNDTTGQTIANADDNTLISGTGGNDSIGNIGDNVTIKGLLGNDTITNLGARSIVDGGLDNDVIENTGANTTIIGGTGNDSISNSESNYNSISAGAGNDTILNEHAYYATLEGGAGNDLITVTRGHYTNIDGGAGDDTILGEVGTTSGGWAMGGYATINGGDGNDFINTESSDSASINGGAGADTIITSGNDSTINGGAGDDIISLNGASVDNNIIEYATGSGNDTIYGLNETGLISLASGEEYSTAVSGDDVILTVGENSIAVAGVSSVNVINYELTGSDIENTVSNTLVTGTRFDDTINNEGSNVTIDAKAGKDAVFNYGASASINGGAGDDSIFNNGKNVTISGDYGDDYVSNWDSNASISGGYGNDTIYNNGSDATINGGGGNDSISNDGENLLIEYSGGMDTVIGVNETSTISVSGDFSKDDIVQGTRNVLIPSGDYFLTLQDAMLTTDSINVNGETIELDKTISLLGSGSATISRSNVTVNAGEGENLITLTDDATNNNIVLAGNTTVDGFKTGFGEGADTIYIDGDPAGVEFKDGGLTFGNSTDSLALSGITTTSKVNIYHERRSVLNKGVFIAENDWYSVQSSDLSVGSGEEVYFVGTTSESQVGVDFSGISSALNVTMDTAYEDSEDFVPGTTTWINSVYSLKGGAGNTTITGSKNSDTIIAGTGATTINAAAGDDNISLGSSAALVQYTSGDGNDTIEGFNSNSTLAIAGDSYNSTKSGDDLIFTVGDDKITLAGAASLSTVNVDGTSATQAVIDSIGVENYTVVSASETSAQNVSLDSGELVVVEDTSANVNITASKGNDTIVSYGENVSVSLQGGKTDIFALGGKMKMSGYNVSTGSGFHTEYEDIFEAVNNGSIYFNKGKLTIGSALVIDNDGNNLVNLFNTNGELQKFGDALEDTTLNLSKEKEDWVLSADKYSTLISGSGNDSIFAFAGSRVDAGAGKNYVEIEATNDDSTSIVLGSGKTTVANFKTGFEDTSDKLFFGVNDVIDFKFDGENVSVKSNDVWHGVLSDVATGADFVNILAEDANGPVKIVVAQEGAVITVDDELADAYYGNKSGIDFTNYEGELALNLGTEETSIGAGEVLVNGINQITAGSGQSSLLGSDANETLMAGSGNATLYGGGGRNFLANSATDKDGSTSFMLLNDAKGAQNTISGFEFLTSDNSFTADKIELGSNFVSNVFIRNSSDVSIEVSNAETAVIQGAVGQNFKVGDYVAQVNTTSLTYDGTANFFVATEKNASLTVSEDVGDEAIIWLGNQTASQFVGNIRTLDASKSSAKAELAGNDTNNTIYGGTNMNSLWGGLGGDDLLQGGAGQNMFFYALGDGNDTISSVNDGDVVYLSNVSLENLIGTDFNNGATTMNFNDGGKLTVNDSGKDVSFIVGDQTYYVNGEHNAFVNQR